MFDFFLLRFELTEMAFEKENLEKTEHDHEFHYSHHPQNPAHSGHVFKTICVEMVHKYDRL